MSTWPLSERQFFWPLWFFYSASHANAPFMGASDMSPLDTLYARCKMCNLKHTVPAGRILLEDTASNWHHHHHILPESPLQLEHSKIHFFNILASMLELVWGSPHTHKIFLIELWSSSSGTWPHTGVMWQYSICLVPQACRLLQTCLLCSSNC